MKTLVRAFFLFLLCLPFVLFSHTSQAAPAGRVPILGLTMPADQLKSYALVGFVAPKTTLHLSIGLALQHQDDLDTLIAQQNDTTSPRYHHYLTSHQFTAQFAPAQKTVDAVTTYMKSQGMHVDSVASNRLFISSTTTVGTTEKAFATTLQEYKNADHAVYVPRVDPSVPEAIGGAIATISGMDNGLQYHPLGFALPRAKPVVPQGYTPTQLRTAYDIQPLLDAGTSGSSQTVALFELDGFKPADINTYLKQYKLGNPRYSTVLVDGSRNSAGAGSIEVELDMEVLSAIAPTAAQKVYIGPNSSAGVNDTYNRIVSDDTASVVSTSWGQCEQASGPSEIAALHTIFQQGAAQGQSFFAASGDSGAYDCGGGSLSVDSPSDDPNVVGVGGTALHTSSTSGAYSDEVAWGSLRLGQSNGGGGGISSIYPAPAYQTKLSLTNAQRMIPDVSADASPSTGYAVYCSSSAAYCSGWSVIGGTSAAAPLWAAIVATINQYLSSKKEQGVGNVNTLLYTINATKYPMVPYHDVTSGTNLYYNALPGYDMATGLGSPDAWNVARDLEATLDPSPHGM